MTAETRTPLLLLNDKNVKIDVYISTYDTIFKDDLTDI
jgi:hypothetical protein